jgi:hypothetical protein
MKVIQDFPNYKVTTDGKVWSDKKGDFLKTGTTNHGYKVVCLINKDVRKMQTVHRLVAEAYIPNPYNKCDINHKDTNKINNNVTNLEWNTRKENCIHAAKHNLYESQKIANSKEIIQLDPSTLDIVAIHCSAVQAAKALAKPSLRAHINRCCRGKGKTAGGFKWQYA